jgi:hypothetical protein
MNTLNDISSSRNMNPAGMGLNWAPENTHVTFNQQLKGLAAQVWAHLTWGRWTAIGLFVAAFIAALWLKHNWVNAPLP